MATWRLVHPKGRVNPGTLIALLLVGAAAYWIVFFSGLYLDHIDVKEALAASISTYSLETPEAARNKLIRRLETIGDHLETSDDGVDEMVAGLAVNDDDVSFEFDPETKQLTVRVAYDRSVRLQPTKKVHTVHFVAERTEAIRK